MAGQAVTTLATETEPPVERAVALMEDKFARALPAHIPPARFVRICMSALQAVDIQRCAATPAGRKSIYDACLKAASDGLLLDGREAALVRFNVKAKDEDGRERWEDRAQYMPMVAGLIKKARNSGEIAAIVAQCVHEHDRFEINYVTDGAPIVHQPELDERGRVIGAYAVARLKDGSWTQPEFMSVAQIEAVRDRSRAKDNGPWKTDWPEMARKTVIRRASKYWPSSTDKDGVAFYDVVRRDDEVTDLSALAEPAPARRSAAMALAAPDIDEVGAESERLAPRKDDDEGDV